MGSRSTGQGLLAGREQLLGVRGSPLLPPPPLDGGDRELLPAARVRHGREPGQSREGRVRSVRSRGPAGGDAAVRGARGILEDQLHPRGAQLVPGAAQLQTGLPAARAPVRSGHGLPVAA